MSATLDPRRLFTDKHRSYVRFIRAVRYPQGIRAFFRSSPLLHPALRVLEAGCGTGVVSLAVRAEANVLDLDTLPASWTGYDLVVSASMLEYVPRNRFVDALRGLRERLKDGGTFVLFMTRRNPLTRLLIGRWWQSNLYTAPELDEAFRHAGFSAVTFRGFPIAARHLSVWGHVVEARR